MKQVFLTLIYCLLPIGVAADPISPSTPQNLRLEAESGNKAPLVADDSYFMYQGRTLDIAAPGVLTNDSDPDNDSLTAKLVSGTKNGVLSLNPDGSFSYTPNPEFVGSDWFSYQANDGELDSNVATVTIAVTPASAAPWIEDSFEGKAPYGWSKDWNWSTATISNFKYIRAETTDAVGTPPGISGTQVHREWWYPNEAEFPVTHVNPETNFITVGGHDYKNRDIFRFIITTPVVRDWRNHNTNFELGDYARVYPDNGYYYMVTAGTGNWKSGSADPEFPTTLGATVVDGDITWTCIEKHRPPAPAAQNGYFYVENVDGDRFQIRDVVSSNVLNLTDEGLGPFFTRLHQYAGQLRAPMGPEWPVPHIQQGEDISISYWLKYHENFDGGIGGQHSSGNKHWMIGRSDGGRIYHNINQPDGRMRIEIRGKTTAEMLGLFANVNGIPGGDQNFYMPNGEWVKFDFYLKVSPVSESKGILKVWVNNVLRWDYSDIYTSGEDESYYTSWLWWLQFASGPPRNQPGVREHQERYLDVVRIGPGAMVLSEQGLLP